MEEMARGARYGWWEDGMRIVRLTSGASCEFRVYPATNGADDLLAQLVRHLHKQGLPFLIGGVVGDHALLLTIGPLDSARATRFACEWAGYLE
jgi:hypothetical protein